MFAVLGSKFVQDSNLCTNLYQNRPRYVDKVCLCRGVRELCSAGMLIKAAVCMTTRTVGLLDNMFSRAFKHALSFLAEDMTKT